MTMTKFYDLGHRDVYKSCMDTEGIEALGIQPMKDILKKFGGWPGQSFANHINQEPIL
jgi:Peptidase family M13